MWRISLNISVDVSRWNILQRIVCFLRRETFEIKLVSQTWSMCYTFLFFRRLHIKSETILEQIVHPIQLWVRRCGCRKYGMPRHLWMTFFSDNKLLHWKIIFSREQSIFHKMFYRWKKMASSQLQKSYSTCNSTSIFSKLKFKCLKQAARVIDNFDNPRAGKKFLSDFSLLSMAFSIKSVVLVVAGIYQESKPRE